jgi:sortase A
MSFNKVQEENNQIDEYLNISIPINSEIDTQEQIIEDNNTNTQINYLMVLEVPKIGLKKGIYDIESKYNSVNYGIEILKDSNMPDKELGNVILASHRGTSNNAYFNKLDNLNNDDIVIIYYQGIKYSYRITNIYDQDKNGSIKILKDMNKTTITLITCKKNTKDKQLVFIGNLVERSNY